MIPTVTQTRKKLAAGVSNCQPASRKGGNAHESGWAAGQPIHLLKDDGDDDPEAEGGHGQIIALELEGAGNPHDHCHQGADDQSGQESQERVGIESGGQNTGTVGPQARKKAAWPREICPHSHEEVKSQHDDDIEAMRLKSVK